MGQKSSETEKSSQQCAGQPGVGSESFVAHGPVASPAPWWRVLAMQVYEQKPRETPLRMATRAMYDALTRQVGRLAYSWHAVGPGTMLRNSLRWAMDRQVRCVDSGFDATYGTDTNALLTPREAEIPALRRNTATMYLPTMDQDLEAMFAALPWSESLRNESTFVDLGSGKGRVVLLAAMRAFRQVVGVELSPILHEVAARNHEIVRASGELQSPVKLINCDAAKFIPPTGPVLAYMYHPFHETVVRDVMVNLIESLRANPRPAAIMYCHPTLQPSISPQVFAEQGLFACSAAGQRLTRHFSLGWTLYTNDAWLRANPPISLHLPKHRLALALTS